MRARLTDCGRGGWVGLRRGGGGGTTGVVGGGRLLLFVDSALSQLKTLDSGCCRSGKRGRAVDSNAALSRRYRYLSRYRYLRLWTPGRGPSLRLRVPAVQLIPAALPIVVLARCGGGVESNEKVAWRLVCHPWCLDSGVQAGKIRRERIFARDEGFGARALQTIAPRRAV